MSVGMLETPRSLNCLRRLDLRPASLSSSRNAAAGLGRRPRPRPPSRSISRSLSLTPLRNAFDSSRCTCFPRAHSPGLRDPRTSRWLAIVFDATRSRLKCSMPTSRPRPFRYASPSAPPSLAAPLPEQTHPIGFPELGALQSGSRKNGTRSTVKPIGSARRRFLPPHRVRSAAGRLPLRCPR